MSLEIITNLIDRLRSRFTSLEIERVIKHLRNDFGDDFWPDINNYRKILNIDINFSLFYRPRKNLVMDIPKPTLILRPGQYINIYDRIYYQALVERFAASVDKKLTPMDVSYGYRIQHYKDKYFFLNNVEKWKQFKKRQETTLRNNSSYFILSTDIVAFFEHIVIGQLKDILKRKFNIRSPRLFKILNLWSNKGIGLPQGFDASSFLSNVYLDGVDKAMLEAGFNYFRFVDDICVITKDKEKTQAAIQKLTTLLRPLNLHLNSGKTEYQSAPDFISNYDNKMVEMEAINYNIKIESEKNIAEVDLKKIWDNMISTKRINKTVFRFCVAKFTQLGSNYIKDSIIENDFYDPSQIDKVANYLKAFINEKDIQKKARDILNKSSYEWQQIHLLKMLISADQFYIDINELELPKLLSSDNFMVKGYTTILIFKFAVEEQKKETISSYEYSLLNNFEVARYYLFATEYLNETMKIEKRNIIFKKYPRLKAEMVSDPRA